jgi:hypothetical protein
VACSSLAPPSSASRAVHVRDLIPTVHQRFRTSNHRYYLMHPLHYMIDTEISPPAIPTLCRRSSIPPARALSKLAAKSRYYVTTHTSSLQRTRESRSTRVAPHKHSTSTVFINQDKVRVDESHASTPDTIRYSDVTRKLDIGSRGSPHSIDVLCSLKTFERGL